MSTLKSKQLWRISVLTSLEAEDAVAELLATVTGCSTTCHFNLETGVSTVSAFNKVDFSKKIQAEIKTGLNLIKEYGLEIGAGKVETAKVKQEDWAESWKKHFKPLEIGKKLLLKPSWIKRKPKSGQAVVVLDPGLSFGTGQHPTTAFCLLQIVRRQKNETVQSLLDVGTGSGILAIAAAKLNYHPIRAFDFDPAAVRVAKANARVNGVTAKMRITRDDATRLPLKPRERYDLVCANLISNLLIAEKARITAQLKPTGTLVLAGILAAEFSVVAAAFSTCGLKLVASKTEKEWRSGAFRFAEKTSH